MATGMSICTVKGEMNMKPMLQCIKEEQKIIHFSIIKQNIWMFF